MIPGSHPILSCDEARELEKRLFGADETLEWAAMERAGRAIGAGVLADFQEIGAFPEAARILVLAGKGHNAGDALIAAAFILERVKAARLDVCFVLGTHDLRPLAARAWRALTHGYADRVTEVSPSRWSAQYDVSIDGLFGFQFRPPVGADVQSVIERANAAPIRLRAAVDLPSADQFHADFTYATGSVKSTVLDNTAAGRVRYLDLDFFSGNEVGAQRVLTKDVLNPLGALRPSRSDKRTFGHLFVVAGSRNYPGAALMAVLAGLRSGVGLVTAFVPESMVPAFAARVPEAIWVGWPETAEGGLALEGLHLMRERESRATALLIGPGTGRESETHALFRELVKNTAVPAVLDADALQPEIVRAAKSPLVLTPHAGEFERIAAGASLAEFAGSTGATVILKGPHTQIGMKHTVYHSFFGGPVLARGGSGDLLAGLTGGLLAQNSADPSLSAAQGVVWHGMAADLLARAHGQVAVQTTQLLDFLGPVLRDI
jgi:hydroxyethylthiazole kinase-like uncharacterized protein yjeF